MICTFMVCKDCSCFRFCWSWFACGKSFSSFADFSGWLAWFSFCHIFTTFLIKNEIPLIRWYNTIYGKSNKNHEKHNIKYETYVFIQYLVNSTTLILYHFLYKIKKITIYRRNNEQVNSIWTKWSATHRQ